MIHWEIVCGPRAVGGQQRIFHMRSREVEVVSLRVYDILGREAAILVNETKAPGRYTAVFNTAGYASGVYLYRCTAGSVTRTMKMMILK